MGTKALILLGVSHFSGTEKDSSEIIRLFIDSIYKASGMRRLSKPKILVMTEPNLDDRDEFTELSKSKKHAEYLYEKVSKTAYGEDQRSFLERIEDPDFDVEEFKQKMFGVSPYLPDSEGGKFLSSFLGTKLFLARCRVLLTEKNIPFAGLESPEMIERMTNEASFVGTSGVGADLLEKPRIEDMLKQLTEKLGSEDVDIVICVTGLGHTLNLEHCIAERYEGDPVLKANVGTIATIIDLEPVPSILDANVVGEIKGMRQAYLKSKGFSDSEANKEIREVGGILEAVQLNEGNFITAVEAVVKHYREQQQQHSSASDAASAGDQPVPVASPKIGVTKKERINPATGLVETSHGSNPGCIIS